jgi:hypothetical protein
MKFNLIFILISTLAFSQEYKTLLLCNQVIDTLPYIQENIERDIFYNVKELKTLDDEYVFRSWAGSGCIEIIKNGKSVSGKIYFAAEGFNDSENDLQRFTKEYELTNKESQDLLNLVESYQFWRREHPSGTIPVVHTFELKQGSNIEVYTTDSPQFDYKISDIIPINYVDEFEKEIPFKNYTYWDMILESKILKQKPNYSTK